MWPGIRITLDLDLDLVPPRAQYRVLLLAVVQVHRLLPQPITSTIPEPVVPAESRTHARPSSRCGGARRNDVLRRGREGAQRVREGGERERRRGRAWGLGCAEVRLHLRLLWWPALGCRRGLLALRRLLPCPPEHRLPLFVSAAAGGSGSYAGSSSSCSCSSCSSSSSSISISRPRPRPISIPVRTAASSSSSSSGVGGPSSGSGVGYLLGDARSSITSGVGSGGRWMRSGGVRGDVGRDAGAFVGVCCRRLALALALVLAVRTARGGIRRR
ncbi:hypothetical protein B0H10DRAFT_1984793, partial [Mycena sp. CBHHK59/15]